MSRVFGKRLQSNPTLDAVEARTRPGWGQDSVLPWSRLVCRTPRRSPRRRSCGPSRHRRAGWPRTAEAERTPDTGEPGEDTGHWWVWGRTRDVGEPGEARAVWPRTAAAGRTPDTGEPGEGHRTLVSLGKTPDTGEPGEDTGHWWACGQVDRWKPEV